MPTKEGELIWETLLSFKNLKSGKISIKKNISCYEYYILKIETDGSNYCKFIANFCLKNNDKEPIKSLVFEANSDTPLYKDLELEYSSNISKYELIEHNYNQKTFRLYFKKPVAYNEIIEFWYSYEWPEMFLNSWSVWDYSITSKYYPIKFFIGNFILNKEHNIIKDSFLLNKTELQKDSKTIGEFSNLEPVVFENSNNKEVIWKMFNVPSRVKYKFSWEHR